MTSRTWQSRKLFVTEPVFRVLVETLAHYREKGIYRLHAVVVMPDHIHVLLTPAADVSLERAVQHIKGGSARRIGTELLMRLPVWQRGFTDHRVRGAEDYSSHVRYIERNPVERQLAESPQNYTWCSAAGMQFLDAVPEDVGKL